MAKKHSVFKWIILLLILIITPVMLYVYKIWTTIPSIQNSVFVYVYPSMNAEQLSDTLLNKKIIKNKLLFNILSKEMQLNQLKPGKYRITNKMTLPAIIRLFKSGKDEKVIINVHSEIFYFEDWIETLDRKLMINKDELLHAINHHPKIKNKEWMNYLFIKQYQVNWAIAPDILLDSIYNYYPSIWNRQRKQLLKRCPLSEKEAMILASIVQHESYIYSEQKKIAGVYINRLIKQMPLQADPTLKYIHHKMNASRVYNADKQIDSPFNTYKHKGLPPYTIGAVSIQSLDAVLNFETHNYLYFCAKPELNGYSNYSSNFQQHLKYAREYQQKLNQLNIK